MIRKKIDFSEYYKPAEHTITCIFQGGGRHVFAETCCLFWVAKHADLYLVTRSTVLPPAGVLKYETVSIF